MHYRWFSAFLVVVCLFPGFQSFLWAQQRIPVKIEGKPILPLRVLARPFSNIYKEKDEAKGTVQENVPAFQPYYVYTKPEGKATETDPKGWYEVGSDVRGTVLGWMKAADVFEWKQTMSLAYTHPKGRQPVLMFEHRETLMDIIKSDNRKDKANQFYTEINSSQKLPKAFPVRSVEPKKAVDISKHFYLLPILEFGIIELEGREGRILKLAAATATGPDAREQADIRDNTAYRSEATAGVTDIAGEKLRTLTIDLVFVMDMTGSMQPYIQATLHTIREISLKITQNAAIREGISFGLWGYRDSKDIPELEFNTKNFTPTLQQVNEFEKTLQGVQEARVSSEDYPEDVFSGVDFAMRETKWHDNALRFIILVGDAPSHALGHPRNYSGQDENTLRAFADDKNIYIFALHIQDPDPRVAPFHALAEPQFRHLARNKGLEGGESSYYSVNAQDRDAFGRSAQEIARLFVELLSQAKQGRVASPTVTPAMGTSSQLPSAGALAAQMGHAALVEWIGRETDAKAPRDIIAWAVDKDLFDPSIPSMEVRLLITKSQLDSLKTVLSAVIAAGRRGQIGGEQFFSALQATAATIVRNPEQVKNARSMADAGMIPEFLIGLPYQSKLMAMSNDLWASWSNDDQDTFLTELDAKVQLYATIHDTPEGWILLNQGDDPDEAVFPISLEVLP